MGKSTVGIDGCKGGWVAASVSKNNSSGAKFHFAPTLKELIAQFANDSLIMIDMPIGLSANDSRRCDEEARKLMKNRGCCVFPAPLRPVVKDLNCAKSYELAKRKNKKHHLHQKKISRQSFALLEKIREVDDLINPRLQARIMETHPELVFWALNEGKPIAISKKEPKGCKKRLKLLEFIFPGTSKEIIRIKKELGGKVAIDDLIDACACLVAARSFLAGKATKVPGKSEHDRRKLLMEINYPQEINEDAYWAAEGEKSLVNFDRGTAIPHKEFWKKALAIHKI